MRLCETRVTQAWNVFLSNFQVLNLFIEPKKISVTESALQTHVTKIRFIIAVPCFQFQNRTLSSFSG